MLPFIKLQSVLLWLLLLLLEGKEILLVEK